MSYAPPPRPQKISGPIFYIEVENSTLSYIVHRMLIRKLLTRKRDLSYSQYSNTNIAKNAEKKNKIAVYVVLFLVNVFKSIGDKTFCLI